MAGQRGSGGSDDRPVKVAVVGSGSSDSLDLAHASDHATVVRRVEEADVVHVASAPAGLRAAVLPLLNTAKCIVLHERPAGVAPAELDRLARRAAVAGTVVAVPFVHRYYPMVRFARRRVWSRTPGPLHLLHGWSTPESAADWYDLVQFISGHVVRRVVAAGVPGDPSEPLDGIPDAPAMGTIFETDRGAVGAVAVSRGRPVDGGALLVALDGVEESIVFHGGRPELLDVMGPRSTERFQRGLAGEVSRYSTGPAGRPQGHDDCWRSFVADAYSVAWGRKPDGLPTLADLVRSVHLTTAIARARADVTWADVGPLADAERVHPTEGTSR